MKKIICAGNWKLNKNAEETKEFLNQLEESVSSDELNDFAVFAPALNLYLLEQKFSGKTLKWGAQNCYWENSGAFTGENSPAVLKSMGSSHCLVGHSERRSLFGETNEETNKKVLSLIENEITPVLCLGETLDERKSGVTNDIIVTQLKEGLKKWDSKNVLWLAYEPVWAIGTGEVATPEQAAEAHKALRDALAEMFDLDFAKNTPILYGGSVKPANSADLAKKENVDGFLIGGASLKVDSFVEIYKNANA